MYAAVDLGGTKIAGALASANGELLAEASIPTGSSRSPGQVLESIARLVQDLSEGRSVAALGMGVPGLVDLERGCTRFLPNFATHWRDVPVGEVLSARLHCRVFLLNDARLATLGELEFGHGRGVASMALLTLGTGIGGGVVVDGELRLGPFGAAGELGHQTILPDGPQCGCGNRGCLETLASGPAISGEGVRLLASGLAPKLYELTGGDAGKVNPKTMAEAAAAGDEMVREIIVRAARYLGIGISNLVTMLHPELVVLTGGVAAIGDLLIDTIRSEVRERVRMFPVDGVRIERSALGEKAGLWGGIALARRGGIMRRQPGAAGG